MKYLLNRKKCDKIKIKLGIKEVRAYCSAHVSAQVYVTSYTNDLQLLYSATIHKYVSLVRLTELMGKYANTA